MWHHRQLAPNHPPAFLHPGPTWPECSPGMAGLPLSQSCASKGPILFSKVSTPSCSVRCLRSGQPLPRYPSHILDFHYVLTSLLNKLACNVQLNSPGWLTEPELNCWSNPGPLHLPGTGMCSETDHDHVDRTTAQSNTAGQCHEAAAPV